MPKSEDGKNGKMVRVLTEGYGFEHHTLVYRDEFSLVEVMGIF